MKKLVLFILWLSHFTLFGQNQQMESRTSNFSTLSSSKNIESLNEWEKYNNNESYNHPEFGYSTSNHQLGLIGQQQHLILQVMEHRTMNIETKNF